MILRSLRGDHRSNRVHRASRSARVSISGGCIISRDAGAERAQIDWLSSTSTLPPSTPLARFAQSQHSPFARWRLTRAAAVRARLIAPLRARIQELRAGICRATISPHRRIRLADGALDPTAIGALAQLSALLVMELSTPGVLEWAAQGLTLEYLRRADSRVYSLARLDKTDWSGTSTVGVPVTVTDAAGSEVARAVISFAVAARSD